MTDENTTGTEYIVEARGLFPHGTWREIGRITAPPLAKKWTVFRSAVAHSEYLQKLAAPEAGEIRVRLIPAAEVYEDVIEVKPPVVTEPVMHIGGKPAEDYRSAITGQFVSADEAAKNEDTTVHESRDAA